MTTITKAKIDLNAMIDLTQEPEPKTLEECLVEAGGFPFVARAVAPSPKDVHWPVGSEFQFVRTNGSDFFFNEGSYLDGIWHYGARSSRRWFLVGHRT